MHMGQSPVESKNLRVDRRFRIQNSSSGSPVQVQHVTFPVEKYAGVPLKSMPGIPRLYS
jgi:hypothetical protein